MKTSAHKTTFYFLCLIILLGACVRLYEINIPLLEVASTRQCQTAAIARNFYHNGINLLTPKMDHFGNQPGYLYMELNFLPAIVAGIYKIMGHVNESWGRIVSIVFCMGSTFFLFRIVRRTYSDATALLACLIFNVLPLSILYTRTFQPESIMLFFSVLCLDLACVWLVDGRKGFALGTCLALNAAILSKLTAAYICLPILYLYWARDHWGVFGKKQFWIFWLFGLGGAAAWYVWGNFMNIHYALVSQKHSSIANWFVPDFFLSSKFWLFTFETMVGKGLTPIGFILFFLGLKKMLKDSAARIYIWWFIGLVVYFILFNFHVGTHRYYMLPITLIGSIGIAVALESFPYRWKFGLIVLVVISGLLQVSSGYKLGKKYEHTIEAGQFIQQITQREDLVICTKGLYYTDRKGWNFIPDKNRPVDAMIADIEGFIQKGARYFLVTYLPLLDDVPEFHQYLDHHYAKIPSPKHFIIYNLR